MLGLILTRVFGRNSAVINIINAAIIVCITSIPVAEDVNLSITGSRILAITDP